MPDSVNPPPEARQRLVDLINGWDLTAAVGAVARLGVADALTEQPLDAAAIADQLGAHPLSLERILLLLTDYGLFGRNEEGAFSLTDVGRLLCSDVPGSLRQSAIFNTEAWMWAAYPRVVDTLRTGQPAFAIAHGRRFWDYLGDHPDAAEEFNSHMAAGATRRAEALARQYDITGVDTLVDIGGGHGALVSAMLQAHPDLRAVVFDLPAVIEGSPAKLDAAGVSDRCDLVGGDFFEAVPAGGDLYVLSWILHDWDDDNALRILTNCRKAIAPNGHLVVVEMVLPPGGDSGPTARLMDFSMLVVVGGRERTEEEYRDMYSRAGFELTANMKLGDLPWSALEGRPL